MAANGIGKNKNTILDTRKGATQMHKMGSALTGLAVGMAVGTAAYMMNSHSMKGQRKKMRKSAMKAAKTVENLMDGFSHMVK